MRTDSFSTAEDELNFILGTDGGQMFDIDNALHDAVEDLGAMPPGAAAAYDGNRDFPLPFAVSGAARSTAAAAFMTDIADDFGKAFAPIPNTISRMASFSPPPNGALGALYAPSDLRDFNEPSFLNDMPTTNFVPQDLDDFKIDFNFDVAHDILPSITPKYFSGPFGTTPCVSDLHRRLWQSQDQFNPFLQDQILPPSSPFDSKPSNKKWAACKYPPIVHPAHLSTVPKGPFRKRKVEIPNLVFIPPSPAPASQSQEGPGLIQISGPIQGVSPEMAHEKAIKARNARKMRRFKRAKSQAINFAFGGNVTEIERSAVLDSDYSRLSLQASNLAPLEQDLLNDLLNDFSRNFNPKLFVESTWEQVYETLAETGETKEVAAIMSSYEVDFFRETQNPPSSQPIQTVPEPNQAMPDPDIFLRATSSIPSEVKETTSAVVTPLKEGNSNLKTLPSGKDPESRRLRRLMRNRLSAQASRDRRKKAIDDKKKQKLVKEEEIALLEKTVSEEIQRMKLLKKAAIYARNYLGPEHYSRVSSHSNTIHSN